MSLGVVLLHYNRWSNLRLALRALKEQTLPLSEFHVVVADDGSTDRTVDEMRHLVRSPEWQGRLRLVSGGPHYGTRISRIFNIGIANLPPECTFFVLLASDMCLAPEALEQFARLHQQHPQSVIITRLDWLPPMPHADIEQIWDTDGFAGLFNCIPEQLMHLVEHTPVGKEPRPLSETATLEPMNSRIFHPVYGVPTELYWRVGGYNEEMVGYGFQDLDFGIRLAQQDLSMITSMEVRALHIWHPKDAEINDLVPWQRQKNTDYMLRKHGSHQNPLTVRKWNYWRHYQRVHGGTILYFVGGEPGLFAVNNERTHCLRLPHAGWLHPLGFSTRDVEFVQQDVLSALTDMGEAADPLNECDFLTLVDDLNTVLEERSKVWQATQVATLLQPHVDHNSRLESLHQHFHEYDLARLRADRLPGAKVPVFGFLIRVLGRIVFAGKVWASERQLLKEIIGTLAENERKSG
jgi:GT2 family glycosyltransferase